MDYNAKIDAIIEYLQKTKKLKNSIIIGKNFIGKTDFFVRFISTNDNIKNTYFIDTCNRVLDINMISVEEDNKIISVQDIVNARIENRTLNHSDSFGSITDNIARKVMNYKGEISELFEKLTGKKLVVDIEELDGLVFRPYVVVDNFKIVDNVRLSSGYQAIIRILLELIYLRDISNGSYFVVLIDEIDLHLSSDISVDFFNFLTNEFIEFSFIVTTHSKDLVFGAKDANVLVISEKNFRAYDCNDIDSMYDVQNIWKDISRKENHNKDGQLEVLKIIYNHYLNDAFDNDDIEAFDRIRVQQLSNLEQVIYDEIWQELSRNKVK